MVSSLVDERSYDAPHGKGVDDIRGTIGHEAFASWFQNTLSEATIVPKDIEQEALILSLIERERATFPGLTGAKRDKAIDQLSKLYESIAKKRNKAAKTLVAAVEELVREPFHISASDFAAMVAEVARRRAEKAEAERKIQAERELKYRAPLKSKTASATPTPAPTTEATSVAVSAATNSSPSDASVAAVSTPFDKTAFDAEETLNSFIMVGEEYYTYSYIKVGSTYRRSKVMSVCGRNFVSQALRAAGFDNERPSTKSLPVVGESLRFKSSGAGRLRGPGGEHLNRSFMQGHNPAPLKGSGIMSLFTECRWHHLTKTANLGSDVVGCFLTVTAASVCGRLHIYSMLNFNMPHIGKHLPSDYMCSEVIRRKTNPHVVGWLREKY
jgi:hypothetical protein